MFTAKVGSVVLLSVAEVTNAMFMESATRQGTTLAHTCGPFLRQHINEQLFIHTVPSYNAGLSVELVSSSTDNQSGLYGSVSCATKF